MNKTHGLAYWLTTMLVAAELALGGVWDLLRIPYVRGVIEHLGYPSYFLVIIGAWKVPGALALVVPRFARLKERAYAGAFLTYSGAITSHLVVGDGPDKWAAPLVFAGLTGASWALRPASRSELIAGPSSASRGRTLAYWIVTGILATECIVGGVMGGLQMPPFIGIIRHLGYPPYFMTILGVWYVLAGVALLAPRFPRVKGVGLRRPSLQLYGRSGIALGGRRWREHADCAGRFHGADARLLGAAATKPQRVSVRDRFRLKAASRHGTLSPAPESPVRGWLSAVTGQVHADVRAHVLTHAASR